MNSFLLFGGSARPAALALGRPVADRHVFRVGGDAWRYKGVTGFKLIELVRRGQDIVPFLRCYGGLGFNVVRAMANKPPAPGLDEGWSTPPLEVLLAYYRILAQEGFYGETTLFGSRVDASFVPQWLEALADVPNAFAELLNEPGHEGQYRSSADLRALCDRVLTLPFASGEYDPPQDWFGSYMTYHSPRDGDPYEAARKAKGVRDLFDGWGMPPDGSGLAFAGARCPVVGDEPGKPQDFGYNLDAILAHFAIYGLLGAGGTFHTLGGQFGNLPSDADFAAAQAAAAGLNAFPADVANGSYVHDVADEASTGSLRTYRIAGTPYGVRVNPKDGPILIGA